MNRAMLIFASSILLIFCGCKEQSDTIVFMPGVSGADQDSVQTFVSDFSLALHEDRACSGVKLILSDPYKDSPDVRQQVESSHWHLLVSVIPQADTDNGKQLWSVIHDGQPNGSAWSEPKSMAHSVCAIVKGTGGSVQSSG